MKVVHVITSVATGGAQTMLYLFLSRATCANRSDLASSVVSLIDIGPVGQKIQALGVPVRALGMKPGVPNPLAVSKLTRWLRQDPPHIVQTWMYHADLVGGLTAKLAGNIPVAWGIHNTILDPEKSKRSTIWTAKTCAYLSPWMPSSIVCCSEASRQVHTQFGYAAKKMVVIPNGFNLTTFKPNTAERQRLRRELKIPEDAPLIGLIARFDPYKDHQNFIQAAAIFHTHLPQCHFLLCGAGITRKNQDLATWIQAAGISGWCHLLGRREDIPHLTAALDVATTSSSGEAFPMVIGEAMACGVPCVVTDVGDSRIIVGETGIVVPPKNPQALATGWGQLLLEMTREERVQLGLAARRRIKEKFSLGEIVARYENLYRSIVTHSANLQLLEQKELQSNETRHVFKRRQSSHQKSLSKPGVE